MVDALRFRFFSSRAVEYGGMSTSTPGAPLGCGRDASAQRGSAAQPASGARWSLRPAQRTREGEVVTRKHTAAMGRLTGAPEVEFTATRFVLHDLGLNRRPGGAQHPDYRGCHFGLDMPIDQIFWNRFGKAA